MHTCDFTFAASTIKTVKTMLERIIESFPAGTTETAKKLLTISMNTGEALGDKLSDMIDSLVDRLFD